MGTKVSADREEKNQVKPTNHFKLTFSLLVLPAAACVLLIGVESESAVQSNDEAAVRDVLVLGKA